MNLLEIFKELNIDVPTAIIYTVFITLAVAIFRYFLDMFNKASENHDIKINSVIDILVDIKFLILNNSGIMSKETHDLLSRKVYEVGKLSGQKEYRHLKKVLIKGESCIPEVDLILDKLIDSKSNIINHSSSFSEGLERIIIDSSIKNILKSIMMTYSILFFSLICIIQILKTDGQPFLIQLISYASMMLLFSMLMLLLSIAELLSKSTEAHHYILTVALFIFNLITPFTIMTLFHNFPSPITGPLLIICDIVYFLFMLKTVNFVKNMYFSKNTL